MMRYTSVLIATVMLLGVLACDPENRITEPPPTPVFKPLTTREAVLHNLQTAYNQRNITRFEEILDNGFTFFLSEADVISGGLPVQWDRSQEVDVTTHLFSRDEDPQGRWPLCTSVQMDVLFENGVQWLDVVPPSAPSETWSTTTVFYDFQIEVKPDTKFIPVPGAKAQFFVRNAGTDTNPKWQLVEWRDLGAGN